MNHRQNDRCMKKRKCPFNGLFFPLAIVYSLATCFPVCHAADENDREVASFLSTSEVFPVIMDAKVGWIDGSGHVAICPRYDLYHPGICDSSYKRKTKPIWLDARKISYSTNDLSDVDWSIFEYVFPSFHNGFIPIVEGKKIGFMRDDGLVVKPKFYEITLFEGNTAWVKDEDGRILLINQRGDILISDMDECLVFSEGIAAVKIENKWGYVNKTGKLVVPCQYVHAESFKRGIGRVTDADGRILYVTRDGNPVTVDGVIASNDSSDDKEESQWEELFSHPDMKNYRPEYHIGAYNEYAVVRKYDDNDSALPCYGIVDFKGRFLLSPEYYNIRPIENGQIIAIRAQSHDILTYGIFHESGANIVPLEYSWISPVLSDNRRAVLKKGKFGFINKWGVVVIPPRFSDAKDFKNGLARVSMDSHAAPSGVTLGGTWGYIDRVGKWIWPRAPVQRLSDDPKPEDETPRPEKN